MPARLRDGTLLACYRLALLKLCSTWNIACNRPFAFRGIIEKRGLGNHLDFRAVFERVSKAKELIGEGSRNPDDFGFRGPPGLRPGG